IGNTITDLTVTTGVLVAGTIDIDGNLNADQNVSTDVGGLLVDGTIDTEGTLVSALGINVGGNSEIGDNVTATSEQVYSGAVTQTAAVTYTGVDSDADGEGIDFGSTLAGGGFNTTIVGAAGFAAAVSGVNDLAADHIDSESTINAGTVAVSLTSDLGGNVTATGEQVYSGAVTQTAAVTYTGVDSDADGDGIDFGSTLAGGGFNTTIVGGAGFAAAVSGVIVLAADHIDSESTISAATVAVSLTGELGGNVTTTGEQVYSGAVIIEGGDRTLTGVDVTFGATLDGAQNLVLENSGVTTFTGAVGGIAALSSLTTDSGGTTAIDGGVVNTIGGQTYNDSVTLGATTLLNGVGVAFGSAIDTGGHDLALDSTAAGNITVSGALSGGGELTVIRGAVQSYAGIMVDGFSVMDVTTSVTFQGTVDVAGDVLIVSRGTVAQTADGRIVTGHLGIRMVGATGDVALGVAANDVDVLAVRSIAEIGKVIFFDIDDLTIDVVSGNFAFPTFAATTGIDTNAGDINITSGGDLTVSQDINAAHDTLTTSIDESITLISRNGDFTLADNTVISSDENTANGAFDDVTGDKLTIIAGSVSGSGDVVLGNNIEVRTDGGVAKQIVPRPTAFASLGTVNDAAFVTLADSANTRSSLTSVGGEFLGALSLLFGVSGEENLEVVVDWGVVSLTDLTASGPAGDAMATANPDEFEFTLDDADKTIFYIDQGGKSYIIPHLYAAFDLTVSVNDRNGREVNTGLIGVRFSVAQHESINVWGGATADVPSFDPLGAPGPYAVTDATGQAVVPTAAALALLSSTDTNPLRQLSQEAAQLPFSNLDATPSGTPLGLAEWEFLTGPAPGFVAFAPQEKPTTDIRPAEGQEFSATISEISGDVEFGAGAASDAAVGTEVYLQIRRQFELDADAEIVIPTIRDNTFISNRDSFESFIRDNSELTDGSGYEVWLITETSGQKVERPIVKFEITGGRPGPATEELPQTFEPYELKELEFEQPSETRPSGENGSDGTGTETSQAQPPADGVSSGGIQRSGDAPKSVDNSEAGSDGAIDEAEDGERVKDAGVQQAVSGVLVSGFTRAARWRRQAESKPPGVRRVARVVRKMEERLDPGVKSDSEAPPTTAVLYSTSDGE
ncbi:MAG: hypothetical protein P8J37_18700, partial [Fuerstiella sp.]|nr:hypothetical protein [Fuerstiella sp.]